MWDYWLNINYSSDETNIPILKNWAIDRRFDLLKYDHNIKHTINLNNIGSITILTEKNKKHVLGRLTGGTKNLTFLDPLGAAVGLLTFGNEKELNIAVTLINGETFLATCTYKSFIILLPYAKKARKNIARETIKPFIATPKRSETIKEDDIKIAKTYLYDFFRTVNGRITPRASEVQISTISEKYGIEKDEVSRILYSLGVLIPSTTTLSREIQGSTKQLIMSTCHELLPDRDKRLTMDRGVVIQMILDYFDHKHIQFEDDVYNKNPFIVIKSVLIDHSMIKDNSIPDVIQLNIEEFEKKWGGPPPTEEISEKVIYDNSASKKKAGVSWKHRIGCLIMAFAGIGILIVLLIALWM